MNQPNPKVDACLKKASKWKEEMAKLRAIALECQLTEELKWGKPCYTVGKGNVLLIGEFKAHCALMFCKGALIEDPRGILLKPGENTQSGRWIKFISVEEITKLEPTLKAYIQKAIAVDRSGREVKYKETAEYPVPDELQKELQENPALKKAFAALTPGRQRGYLLYFSGAKQSATRASRIRKCLPRILDGKGLHDR